MESKDEFFSLLQAISKKLREFKVNEIRNIDADDFPISYFRYIETIYEMKNPTFIELAKSMNLSKPTVTIMVNKLIDEDYIVKTRSNEDKRNYYLSLSEKGEMIIDSYQEMHKKFVEEISARYSNEELNTLISLLKKMM